MGIAIAVTNAIDEKGSNFFKMLKLIFDILIEDTKLFLLMIPTKVIRKINEGEMITEIKAPSILF